VISINGFQTSQPAPQFTLSVYSPLMVIGVLSFDGVKALCRDRSPSVLRV